MLNKIIVGLLIFLILREIITLIYYYKFGKKIFAKIISQKEGYENGYYSYSISIEYYVNEIRFQKTIKLGTFGLFKNKETIEILYLKSNPNKIKVINLILRIGIMVFYFILLVIFLIVAFTYS